MRADRPKGHGLVETTRNRIFFSDPDSHLHQPANRTRQCFARRTSQLRILRKTPRHLGCRACKTGSASGLELPTVTTTRGIKHQLVTHFAGNAEISATIIQAAKDVAADLIVMKTHGRHGIAHFIIGSVAEHVVREAPCPVLTLTSAAKDRLLAP